MYQFRGKYFFLPISLALEPLERWPRSLPTLYSLRNLVNLNLNKLRRVLDQATSISRLRISNVFTFPLLSPAFFFYINYPNFDEKKIEINEKYLRTKDMSCNEDKKDFIEILLKEFY